MGTVQVRMAEENLGYSIWPDYPTISKGPSDVPKEGVRVVRGNCWVACCQCLLTTYLDTIIAIKWFLLPQTILHHPHPLHR